MRLAAISSFNLAIVAVYCCARDHDSRLWRCNVQGTLSLQSNVFMPIGPSSRKGTSLGALDDFVSQAFQPLSALFRMLVARAG